MKRVLIVDDAVTVRMYHRQQVEEIGLKAEEAANGVEALEKMMRDNFDLLLVDVNMPKMDGYRFLKEVRQNPELMSIPAIMISTEAGEQDEAQAYEAGANYYLVKPVQPEVLQSIVNILVGGTR